jgi:hypothetical protein
MAMLKNGLLVSSLCLTALLVGCGPEPEPAPLTFTKDIQPIMASRCVRCHGGGGTLNNDPEQQGGVAGPPLYGYFDQFDDQGVCTAADGKGTATCKRGLGYFATTMAVLLKTYLHDKTNTRMPPPPTPSLSEHQLDTLDRWLAAPVK